MDAFLASFQTPSLNSAPGFFLVDILSEKMSVYTLSTLLAMAATFVSDQESTFPAMPLDSKHFAYPTGIVSLHRQYHSFAGLTLFFSHTKSIYGH